MKYIDAPRPRQKTRLPNPACLDVDAARDFASHADKKNLRSRNTFCAQKSKVELAR